MNKNWHSAHPMPKNANDEARIAWHLEHVKNCGCRPVPKGVVALMEKRGIPVPARKAEQAGSE